MVKVVSNICVNGNIILSANMMTVCLLCRHTPKSTDGDFEELMNRNRAVASSAITKAVSGATAGKYS